MKFVRFLSFAAIPLLFNVSLPAATDFVAFSTTKSDFSLPKLREAQGFAERSGSLAGVVLYKGKVLLMWGNTSKKAPLFSCRKPFLSALIGKAIQENKLSLEQTLQDLNVDEVEDPLTNTEKRATIADLLKNRSGVYHPSARETDSMKANRPERGTHLAGTHFYYSNWDFDALATIYKTRTRQSLAKSFHQEIAMPLGFEDFDVSDFKTISDKEVSEHAASAVRMSARDLARFGLLYLQKGQWQGKQLIPESWVEESTRLPSEMTGSEDKGFGYLWWISRTGQGLIPGVRLEPNAFMAEGLGGQFLIVSPAQDLVIVSFSSEESLLKKRPSFNVAKLGTFLSMLFEAKIADN